MKQLIQDSTCVIKKFQGKEHIVCRVDHEAEDFEIDVQRMWLKYSVRDYKDAVVNEYEELLYGLRDPDGIYEIVGTYKSLDFDLQDQYKQFLIHNGADLDYNYLLIKKL